MRRELLLVLCFGFSLLGAAPAAALDADEVVFDDSASSAIQGTNVQQALESADALLTEDTDADEVLFDDSATSVIQGANVQEALESVDALYTGVDADAEVVDLRKDCSGRRNCFVDMDDLLAWIVGTRTPDEDEPLRVEIGPGRFGHITCDSEHPFEHVAFHGAGREHTTIGEVSDAQGLHAQDCEDLDFEDLAVAGSLFSVYWLGSGSSTWTDTNLYGSWYDAFCGDVGSSLARSRHYFFDNQMEAHGNLTTFISYCGENWIYGGDILYRPGATSTGTLAALHVGGRGDVRIFGASIRIAPDDLPVAGAHDVVGAWVGKDNNWFNVAGNGALRVYGGVFGIDLSSKSAANVTGIRVSDPLSNGSAQVQAPGTAFQLVPGTSGTRTRLEGPRIDAPYQWPAGTAPPALASKAGQDLFVETDCKANGACSDTSPAGTQSHLMIYDHSCSSSPWRNVNTNACRDVSVP